MPLSEASVRHDDPSTNKAASMNDDPDGNSFAPSGDDDDDHHHHHDDDDHQQQQQPKWTQSIGSVDGFDDLSRPLSRKVVFAYGVGHMLNDVTAASWFTYLLIFLTGIGLSPRCTSLYNTDIFVDCFCFAFISGSFISVDRL
jgi:hypothetical protein